MNKQTIKNTGPNYIDALYVYASYSISFTLSLGQLILVTNYLKNLRMHAWGTATSNVDVFYRQSIYLNTNPSCKIDDDGGNNLFSFSPGPFPKLILFKHFVKNLKVHARGATTSILDVYQWNFGRKSFFSSSYNCCKLSLTQ